MASEKVVLEVETDGRFGTLGQTGSGKSTLAVEFVSKCPRAVVVDTKHEIEIPDFKKTSKADAVYARFSAPERVIYRPPRGKVPDSFWDGIWARYGNARKENTVVYVDEAGNVTSPAKIPPGLRSIAQMGRSVRLGLWWSAQRPTGVHNVLLTQSEKLCFFFQQAESDREKLAGVVGKRAAEAMATLEPFEFITYGFPNVEVVSSGDGAYVQPLYLEDGGIFTRAQKKRSSQKRAS